MAAPNPYPSGTTVGSSTPSPLQTSAGNTWWFHRTAAKEESRWSSLTSYRGCRVLRHPCPVPERIAMPPTHSSPRPVPERLPTQSACDTLRSVAVGECSVEAPDMPDASQPVPSAARKTALSRTDCCPAGSPWFHPPEPHKSYKGCSFPYSSPRANRFPHNIWAPESLFFPMATKSFEKFYWIKICLVPHLL